MSDEFLRVATQEINEELEHIGRILNSCNSDSDVVEHCKNIEGHFHKIKGLTPMMGKEKIGKISEMLDSILKNILDGKKIEGIYDVMLESHTFMKNSMSDQDSNYDDLENKIKERYSQFID